MGHPGLTNHRTSCLFVVAMVPFAGEPRGVRWSYSPFPFLFPFSPSTSSPLSHLHMRLPVPQLRSDRHPYPPDTRTAMLHLHHQTRHLTQSWPRLQPEKRGAETWRKQTIPPTRFPSAPPPRLPSTPVQRTRDDQGGVSGRRAGAEGETRPRWDWGGHTFEICHNSTAENAECSPLLVMDQAMARNFEVDIL